MVLDEEWDGKKQMCTNPVIQAELNRISAELYKLWVETDEVNPDSLVTRWRNGEPKLIDVVKDYITYQSSLPDANPGTLRTYRTRFKNLVGFLEDNNSKNIEAERVRAPLLENLKSYIVANKCGNNHAGKHVQFVKTALDWATRHGKIKHHFAMCAKAGIKNIRRIIFLDDIELGAIKEFRPPTECLQRVQLIFLFQCETGLAYKDLSIFDPSKHIVQFNERKILWMDRSKSGIETSVPWTKDMSEIIEKLGGQLPKISNGNYNLYLKQIAALCGITKNLTTHLARKTCGRIWLQRGKTMDQVSRILGHASVKTTESYYARLLASEV